MSNAKASQNMPRCAMVLAAGRGERLRPLTDRLPKPLVEIRGEAMLDRALDRLAAAGVSDAVVNLHHLGDQIEAHLATRTSPKIVLSREKKLLDTGGGVRAALQWLGEAAFFVLNGDVVWLDGTVPALARLARAWDEATMDALLLLHPSASAYGYDGSGDFLMATDGRLRRRRERVVAPFVFAGLQILHPRLFVESPDGPFSLNRLYDLAEKQERLWGLRHDGEWFHIGTLDALQGAEDALHYMSAGAVQR